MSERKRILIIGGNGFVGINLAKELVRTHQVVCTHGSVYTRLPGVEYLPFRGLTDKDQGKKLMLAANPDVVIYAVGSNSVAFAENDTRMAQHHHTNGAAQLQSASEIVKARFIYLSADVVFSGHGGNFSEQDIALATTALGKAKLGAENHIRSRSLNYLILRMAPLLGRGTLEHPSWVDQLREQVLLKRKFEVSQTLVRNPVHISVLSELILKSIELDLKNQTLHLGGLTKVSEAELAHQVSLALGMNSPFHASHESADEQGRDYSLNFTKTLHIARVPALTLTQSLAKLITL